MYMDAFYRITEYLSVLGGYMFLMFLWPTVVFARHLKGKGLRYRFCFCTTVQIVIVNTVILGLVLSSIWNRYTVIGIFYGIFLVMLLYNVGHFCFRMAEEALNRNTDLLYCVRVRCKEGLWDLTDQIKGRFSEYLLLTGLLLFGLLYFSYGVMQVPSYGSGDVYTQHALVNGLLEGSLLSEGVRPMAMQCFAVCMNMLFRIPVYSILMYLQCVHVAVFLTAAYLLLREIFHWRYVPVFVLTVYLVWDLKGADLIYSMAGLQWTLPVEFGLYTIFLGVFSFVRYLKSDAGDQKEKLRLFLVTVAAAVAIDFYVAVMVILMCLPFAVYKGRKVTGREAFIPLLAGLLCGCLIGAVPMMGACLSGAPLQEACYSAVSTANTGGDAGTVYGGMRTLREMVHGIDTYGYTGLYGAEAAGWIRKVSWLAGFLGLIGLFWKKRPFYGIGEYYIPTVFASILFVMTYVMPYVGLPQIVPEALICSAGHMLILAVLLIPADVVFSVGAVYCKDKRMRKVSVCFTAGICGAALITDHYHGYLFCELYRHEAAAMVTNSILENFPENSYVIIAPTDERYPVLGRGWHEELVSFIGHCENADYMLPQEYIFLYVEKRPLLYAQTHFLSGPSWLASEKYQERYWEKYSRKNPYGGISQDGQIITGEISEEAAGKDLPLLDGAKQWEFYTRLENRTILESKVYDWCQRFMQRYPYEMNVYYEDDDFVCYYLVQDLNNPYRLGWN